MNEVEGCFVYDIDDLQQVAAANLADRSREAAAAETIVAREVEKYQQRAQSLDVASAIRTLQEHAEALRQAELRRSAGKLAGLTVEQQAAIEALTRSLTNKFLHAPMTALREAAREGDAQALADLESLFTNQSRNRSEPSSKS
jgi:glutamyl-tRNA reductase